MFRRLGFTMIELLIVIAVLGILAVAVLAAINPIEQINRGKDTGSRSDAEQLVSAIDRYYASKGYYPWVESADSLNTSTFGAGVDDMTELTSSDVTLGGETPALAPLEILSTGGASELKLSYITRISDAGYNSLHLYNNGDVTSSTYVCFKPKSASFREEAWKRCSVSGALNPNLPTDMPANACADNAAGACGTAASADLAVGCYICLP